jgi:hypothetical protein
VEASSSYERPRFAPEKNGVRRNSVLNRLQLFRNIGQFDSVAAGAALAMARLTLGYAENGPSKTTLAAVFRSLSSGDALSITERHRLGANDPPHIVIDCTGGPRRLSFSTAPGAERYAERYRSIMPIAYAAQSTRSAARSAS